MAELMSALRETVEAQTVGRADGPAIQWFLTGGGAETPPETGTGTPRASVRRHARPS